GGRGSRWGGAGAGLRCATAARALLGRSWAGSSVLFVEWRTIATGRAGASAWGWQSRGGRWSCTRARFERGMRIRACYSRLVSHHRALARRYYCKFLLSSKDVTSYNSFTPLRKLFGTT